MTGAEEIEMLAAHIAAAEAPTGCLAPLMEQYAIPRMQVDLRYAKGDPLSDASMETLQAEFAVLTSPEVQAYKVGIDAIDIVISEMERIARLTSARIAADTRGSRVHVQARRSVRVPRIRRSGNARRRRSVTARRSAAKCRSGDSGDGPAPSSALARRAS